MKKRKTKSQIKQEQEKQALWQRVHDIACGATEGYFFRDAEGPIGAWEIVATLDTEAFGRFVNALRIVFALDDSVDGHHRAFMVEPQCLYRFATVDSATEFLYSMGVRA
jgi:hypothetical protein